ncbi:MAG: Uma2 family endonuclease [Acidobacteria bacterium]|nr:Uma2 family endonuclease [Acidobacteriota bacterium]
MAHPIALADPLVTGQHMDLEEFVRRWDALPDLKNAELIDGVVYVASPVGPSHGTPDIILHTWMCTYSLKTPGVEAVCNTSCEVSGSMPQPDSALRILPEYGGRTRTGRSWIDGPPDLIVEVSDSSVRKDLGPKRALYERSRVSEYITYEVATGRLTWRWLGPGGIYRVLKPEPDGSIRSRIFPGLWLDPKAIATNQSPLPMLAKGMRSPEYREFRKLLRGRRQRKGEE